MAATAGIEGLVTSWTNYSGLLSGIIKPSEFSLTVNAPELDSTGFAANPDPDAFMDTFLAGLYDWSGTITAMYPNTPKAGNAGLFSYDSSSDYDNNIRSWDMTIECTELEATPMTGTAILAKSWLAGKCRWSGTFEAYIDGTTALTVPTPVGTAAAAATFKLTEDGATDNTLTGSILATQLSASVRVGDVNTATYSYRGTGSLTATGTTLRTASNGIFDATDGLLQRPVVTGSTLTLQAASGRTYAGLAFPRRIVFRVTPSDIIRCTIDFRGSGTLSPA